MNFPIIFNLISIFPSMFEILNQGGVIARAIKNKKIQINILNPRDFTKDKHRTVDDKPYGGSDGMLMKGHPLKYALESLDQRGYVIYLSPQGKRWTDQKARFLVKEILPKQKNISVISGRYAGIDQRFINQYVDEEISIGDYILSGGELAAMVLIDTLTRFLPSVLNHKDSKNLDSFSDFLLEAPQFTRPFIFEGKKVPDLLLSGDHQKIKKWKRQVSLVQTFKKREDLIKKLNQKTKGKLNQELKTAIFELSQWKPEDLLNCNLQDIEKIKNRFEAKNKQDREEIKNRFEAKNKQDRKETKNRQDRNDS